MDNEILHSVSYLIANKHISLAVSSIIQFLMMNVCFTGQNIGGCENRPNCINITTQTDCVKNTIDKKRNVFMQWLWPKEKEKKNRNVNVQDSKKLKKHKRVKYMQVRYIKPNKL